MISRLTASTLFLFLFFFVACSCALVCDFLGPVLVLKGFSGILRYVKVPMMHFTCLCANGQLVGHLIAVDANVQVDLHDFHVAYAMMTVLQVTGWFHKVLGELLHMCYTEHLESTAMLSLQSGLHDLIATNIEISSAVLIVFSMPNLYGPIIKKKR